MENRPGSPQPQRPHTGATRARTVLLAVALVAAVVLYATAVWAAATVDVPISTVLRGNPGEVFPIDTVAANTGDQCTAVLEARNNRSVHPNSDILVGPIVFADVEDGAFQKAGLSFTATGPIAVAVRLGGDGVFSAGFLLEVTCSTPEPPTTTTITTTTTTPPGSSTTVTVTPTTTPSSVTVPPVTTTTLSPPPSGPVDAGGGACADGCEYQPWTDPVILGLAAIAAALLTAIGILTLRLVTEPE